MRGIFVVGRGLGSLPVESTLGDLPFRAESGVQRCPQSSGKEHFINDYWITLIGSFKLFLILTSLYIVSNSSILFVIAISWSVRTRNRIAVDIQAIVQSNKQLFNGL